MDHARKLNEALLNEVSMRSPRRGENPLADDALEAWSDLESDMQDLFDLVEQAGIKLDDMRDQIKDAGKVKAFQKATAEAAKMADRAVNISKLFKTLGLKPPMI